MMVYFVNMFLLWPLCVAQLSEVSQPVSFLTVKLGDSATVECHINSDMKKRVWYKLTSGNRLQLVAAFNDFFNRSIYADTFHQYYSVKFDKISSHLSVSATTREVAGTYFCGVMNLNNIQFGQGTFLMLQGETLTSDSVVQQPESQSVQPGDSVTLSCSVHTGRCAAEHTSVMWWKISHHSAPQMIYSSGNNNHICQTTESGETRCVYELLRRNLSSDDAGTYYCAVASCGHILFGNGTKLDIEDGLASEYFWTGVSVFTSILVVILALSVCMMSKRHSCQPKESPDRSSAASTANTEGCNNVHNLYYAALNVNLANGSRGQRDQIWSTCVYNRVKQEN